ncbi:thiamine phosphate synthase [Parabacteroides sp. OttesenSCG-928-G07]|nr:thiamine phosphate synthase [Parabacteroides sp. OttesenSCG-928-G21]MDL2277581.1 thiamine phosphate synthase [Parabacteroides sp. OttesenSCG-928-G07]
MRKLIGITTPYFFDGEAAILTQLLEEGITRLHIRKPGGELSDMELLIRSIPAYYYPQISLHDCFQLAEKYSLGGLHLNSRNTIIPTNFSGILSRSLHNLDEIDTDTHFDYMFLSPIFDSISKVDYHSHFSLEELKRLSDLNLINNRIIALGGIDETTIPLLDGINFGGVAVLGGLWGNDREHKTEDTLRRFKNIRLLMNEINQ